MIYAYANRKKINQVKYLLQHTIEKIPKMLSENFFQEFILLMRKLHFLRVVVLINTCMKFIYVQLVKQCGGMRKKNIYLSVVPRQRENKRTQVIS